LLPLLLLPLLRQMEMFLIIALMMQCNTIKLLKGVRDFAAGGFEVGIQGDALHVARGDAQAFVHEDGGSVAFAEAVAKVHAGLVFAFFDVAEVDRVDAAAGVGDDWGFHVPEQGPRGWFEEGVGFDVAGAGAGAEAAELVFDEEFADERFAEAGARNS
jgi:hypothetical protein